MKVKYVPYQPHCFAFGGFEIQMLSTLDAVNKSGVQADKIDVWSRENNFEILHCWGLGFHHYENIRWAKHAKKKIVLTALLSYYENYVERIRHFFSTYIKKAQYYIEIANMADAVVVVNEQQAEVCYRYFKVPKNKIFIIPNIVHKNFYGAPHDTSFAEKINFSDYVLTVGSVCQRKNQLHLVQACLKENLNLVIVGKTQEGSEDYGVEIERTIKNSPTVTWIKGLAPNSKELISAYQSSLLVALPSYVEQQPITLLEAVAIRKPLLIANRAYAHQKYYHHAMCVDPDSVVDISRGLKEVITNPTNFIPSTEVIEACREANVGNSYRILYERIL